MRHFNVNEAFQLLQKNKITTNEESVRRWLRQGVIKGIPPTSQNERLGNFIVIEISIGRWQRPLAKSGKVDTNFTRKKGHNIHE